MKPIGLYCLALPVLIAAAAPQAASAQTPVPLAEFSSIELNGGGRIHLRHGPVQRVTLLKGSPEITRFQVRHRRDQDARLVIDACRASCRNYTLEVEIVTPDVASLSVNGGGRIESAGRFPRQSAIGAAVNGGGLIDIRSLPVRSVGAAVMGGGRILTRAEGTLSTAISGGGEIRYWGDPVVNVAIQGGGSVERGS